MWAMLQTCRTLLPAWRAVLKREVDNDTVYTVSQRLGLSREVILALIAGVDVRASTVERADEILREHYPEAAERIDRRELARRAG